MKVTVVINVEGQDDAVSSCVEGCRHQIDSIEAEGKYSFDMVLNTDGKTSFETVMADAQSFPDFCLWIGEPVSLNEGAIASMLENSEFLRHRAIIAGTVCDNEKRMLYGGRSKYGKLVEPDPIIPVPCHLYDAVLLLIPRYAFRKVASPSDLFKQGFFDYGCGEKAARANVPRVVAPGICGVTQGTEIHSVWKDSSKPMTDRLVSLLASIGREMLRVIHSIIR